MVCQRWASPVNLVRPLYHAPRHLDQQSHGRHSTTSSTHTHTSSCCPFFFYLLLSNRVGEFCTASIFAPLLPHSLKVSPEANHGLPHQTSPALFPRYLGSLSHVILSQQITRLWLYFSVILDTLSTENHDYALSYTIPKKAYLIGGNVSNQKARPCLLHYLLTSIRSKSIPARRKNSPLSLLYKPISLACY